MNEQLKIGDRVKHKTHSSQCKNWIYGTIINIKVLDSGKTWFEMKRDKPVWDINRRSRNIDGSEESFIKIKERKRRPDVNGNPR